MLVKICGVTTPAMARQAAEAGADLVGVVLVDSPRRVSPERARDIARALPPHTRSVAVFHHTSVEAIERICAVVRPDLIQVEPTAGILRAFGPRLLPVFHDGPTLRADVDAYLTERPDSLILVEAAGRGGRGVRPDWGRVSRLTERSRIILAGGLTPGNIREAVRRVSPRGVDVSSGVERRPGEKDANQLHLFIKNARGAHHVDQPA